MSFATQIGLYGASKGCCPRHSAFSSKRRKLGYECEDPELYSHLCPQWRKIFQDCSKKHSMLHGLPRNINPWLWSCLLLNSSFLDFLLCLLCWPLERGDSKWSATNRIFMEITLKSVGRFVKTFPKIFQF